MTDEGGVLGNLPNSRPGKRSAKRERPAKAARTSTAKRASAKPGAAAAGAARPRRRTTAVKRGGTADGVDPVREPEPSGDAVSAVVRTAAGLAATGVKVAGAITQELLRRLPRP
jgi:hypothetical protein